MTRIRNVLGLLMLFGLSSTAALSQTATSPGVTALEDEEARPEVPDPLILGNEAFEAFDYTGAIAAYGTISPVEIPPLAQNRLGVAYHLLGRVREAEATYRVAVARDKERPEAYGNLGALYYSRQDFKGAEGRFKDALELDPENAVLLHNLHAARYARENSRSVRSEVERLRESNPLLVDRREGDLIQVTLLIDAETQEDLADLEVRGDIFMARKMFEDAIIEYERSVRIDDSNAITMNKLGIAYHNSQRLRDAEKMYKESLKLNPYYLQALNNLGSVEHAAGRFSRAIDYYRRALEINPESATVLQNLGACLFAMERYEEGLFVYQRAFQLDPGLFDRVGGAGTLIQTTYANESMVNFYLAKVFANSGDADRAMSFLYRAVEEGFDNREMLEDPAFEILSGDERFLALLASFESS